MNAQKANGYAAEPPDKQREVRFGLVMYGGVSLAIYINGVAAEFFRAVRGRGVYKLIKALTDSDIIVDVISGTSAGGINGILLAYALCNNKEFSTCANLWRIDGDIRSLLRSPDRDVDSTESLFDSEGYYQPRLEAAFREMPDCMCEDREYVSELPELDLFVTGTDVDGNIFTQFDDAGHPIDVKDHRSVFLLKHRSGRKEPFNPYFADCESLNPEATFQALGKLARITSCFPAAFTPVRVANEVPGKPTADGKLQLWGLLGKDSCFLDGGVIDNKPFTYTIKEIFYRVADRQIERKLFYVEPDPEHFLKPDTATQPNFIQAIIASLIGIPGYESIADDLKLLAKHNSRIKQYQRLRSHLEENVEDYTTTRKDKELYERCSLVAISERVIEGILKVNGREELLSQDARLAASALIKAFDAVQKKMQDDTAVRDDTSGQTSRTPRILRNFDVYYRLRRLFRTVYKIEETLRRNPGATEKQRKAKERYRKLWRILNRQIELLDIVRVQMEHLIDEAPVGWEEEIADALKNGNGDKSVNQEAELIWSVINTALQKLIESNEKPATTLQQALKQSEKTGQPLQPETLSTFNALLKEQSKAIIKDIASGKIKEDEKAKIASRQNKEREKAEKTDASAAPPPEFKGIFQITREFEKTILNDVLEAADPDDRLIRDAYFDFEKIDAQLFPIELVAELNEKDIIETIRISPRDAEKGFSRKGLADKVSGDAMYHFGGFFKRSWRSNDILWGRLDSLCQLIETLLEPQRIRTVLQNSGQLEKIRARFFNNSLGDKDKPDWKSEMLPSTLFPNAGKTTHDELAGWLEELLWYAPLRAQQQPETTDAPTLARRAGQYDPLDRDIFAARVERIIEAAQLEVLHEDLPNVITDALEEQAKWNQFSYPRRDPLNEKKKNNQGGANGNGSRTSKAGAGASRDDLSPFVFKPAGGSLDPFVSVLAAAGASHEVMQRFKESSGNPRTPMETQLGKFFDNGYKVGSEALTRDMPILVLLEIVSVSLLVLRNCVLKIFGNNAARIKSHPLYIGMVDFPLRAFNTLVLFLRRVPSSRKWLPFTLAGFAIFALFVGITWRYPIIWDRQELKLHWFAVFIAAPLLILGTQGVYLWRGKVTKQSWLRVVPYFLIALLLLFPYLMFAIGYKWIYDNATNEIVRQGQNLFSVMGYRFSLGRGIAKLGVLAALIMMLLGPWIAMGALAWLRRKRRATAKELQSLLEKYFSIPEMILIIRRLNLFTLRGLECLPGALGLTAADALKIEKQNLRTVCVILRKTLSGLKKKERGFAGRLEALTEKIEGLRKPKAEPQGKQQGGEKDTTAETTLDKLFNERQEVELNSLRLKREKADVLRKLDGLRERRRALALEAFQHVRQVEETEDIGIRLAARIVARAKVLDKNKKREPPAKPYISQLEDLMYSINPEALRGA